MLWGEGDVLREETTEKRLKGNTRKGSYNDRTGNGGRARLGHRGHKRS